MPPADPSSLLPVPVPPNNRNDPFHQSPPFDHPPYQSEEDREEEQRQALEKVHQLDLEGAKTDLRNLTMELQAPDARRVRPLTLRIQRMRVAVLLLQEAHTGIADPGTNRELNLLNKLVTGRGLDEMDEQEAREEAQARAKALEDRMRDRGADPAAAQRIARALQAVMRAPAATTPEGPDGPAEPYSQAG